MDQKQTRLTQLIIVLSILTSSIVFITVFRVGEKFGKSLARWF